MKTKFSGVLTLFMAFVVQLAFAQEKTITGTVTDAESGMPLAGVNIVIEGTTTGTQTDFDGNYSLQASTGQTMVFSYVGYADQEIAVSSDTTVNISMAASAAELEQVVIMGYTSKSEDLITGAPVQIGGEEISNSPVVTATEALQGKVAGVSISASSGTPGSVQDIRIRGISSLTANNDPLYVINGVPVLNENAAAGVDRSTLSPLSAINANDIESVTVLKSAAATAAYGARGANGVIVITTKDGKEGQTVFSFSSTVGVKNDAYNKRKVLTGAQKVMLLKESLVGSYGADYGVTMDNALQFGADNGLLNPAILDYNGERYNWGEDIKNEDALIQNYTISAAGGGEKGSFYASLGYNKTEATVVGAEFERVTGALNFNQQLRDNIHFATSVNLSNVKQNPILERGSFFSNPFITRYLMNPLNPIHNTDGTYNTDLPYGSLPNIFYVLENNYTRNMLTRGSVNSNLDWEIVDNLTFSNKLGVDYQIAELKVYQNPLEGDGDAVNGLAEVNDSKNFNYVLQSSLKYDFDLNGGHNLDVTALMEYQKNENFTLYGYGENFPTSGLRNLASASANHDASSSYFDWYNVSYLGLINYDFNAKYVLNMTYRREGSSKFAQGKRYGDFGSVGAAWNIHKEDFLPEVFSQLKLRASFGITGNSGIDINTYQALLGYSGAYDLNGAGAAIQFGNPDLTWEKNEIFDVGFDFGLWDNKLHGTFAYFTRRTYDLLYAVPLSYTTGFDSQIRNAGEMTNKGIEIQLGYDIVNSNDWLWTISGNYATVENEITKLPIGTDGEAIDRFSGSVYKTDQVGSPTGTWYMRTWAGVDPQTGAPTWYLNGRDGEVTSNYNEAERVKHGSALPTYSGGIGTRVQYKGFFIDADIYFSGGHKIYEQFAQFYMNTGAFTLRNYNGVQELLDRWQNPGDVTDVPRLDFAGSDNFQATSTRHLYDGDYIRLKNVSIGYNLPSKYAEAIGLAGLTLTLKGSNIATWVKDDGLKLDPEVRIDGYTRLSTPPTESYTFGINAKF